MPIVQIHLIEGRDDQKKEKLIKEVTKAICDCLELEPRTVTIILSEISPTNLSIAGETFKNKNK